MLRIRDHTEPKSAERSEGPVGKEFICRSKKSIGVARGRRSRGARGLTFKCRASRAMGDSISSAALIGKRDFAKWSAQSSVRNEAVLEAVGTLGRVQRPLACAEHFGYPRHSGLAQ